MSNDAYVATAPAPGSDSYAVNRLNQYEQVRDATFNYDDNGNLNSDSGPGHSTSYVYDAENRLVSASGRRTATLVYDPLGRLFSVTGASSATQFLYDGDALVAEYDTAGNLLRRYVHGSNAAADDPLIWYEGASGRSAGAFRRPPGLDRRGRRRRRRPARHGRLRRVGNPQRRPARHRRHLAAGSTLDQPSDKPGLG